MMELNSDSSEAVVGLATEVIPVGMTPDGMTLDGIAPDGMTPEGMKLDMVL
jgi:hypothetical protein